MPTQAEIDEALAWADHPDCKHVMLKQLAAALRAEKAHADLLERQCLEWLQLVDDHGLCKEGATERRLVIEMASRHHDERAELGRRA